MLRTRIPLYFTIVAAVVSGGVTFGLLHHRKYLLHTNPFTKSISESRQVSGDAPQGSTENPVLSVSEKNNLDGHLTIARQKGYEFMKPMLLAKTSQESIEYAPLKAKIMAMVDDDQRSGLLTNATVYLMKFDGGKWMYANPTALLHPGSLVKVPMLITYLKEAETDPKVLDKKIYFEKRDNIPVQTFNSNAIKPGQFYSVRDLLHYMIAYSDNNATYLLNENINLNSFIKTFTDLNVPMPDVKDRNYEISARRISKFFIVLYNATYLSRATSEYALKLLSECDFKDAMLRGLPGSVSVAHKFGEWGDYKKNIHELHECGIVYLNNSPYLLTVMTQGANPKDLATEISKISKMVYDMYSENPTL